MSEFELARTASASTPITQVMGSSIYHVGWQNDLLQRPDRGAHALRRLQRVPPARARRACSRRPRLCGADAVVGVRIEQGSHDWAPGAVEFVAHRHRRAAARGDARAAGAARCSPTSTARSSGSSATPGIRPVGIVAAHERPLRSRDRMQTDGQGASSGHVRQRRVGNQELVDYTAGRLRRARARRWRRSPRRREQLGASGVVGVRVGQHVRVHTRVAAVDGDGARGPDRHASRDRHGDPRGPGARTVPPRPPPLAATFLDLSAPRQPADAPLSARLPATRKDRHHGL